MHLQDRNVRAPLDLFHRTYHSLLRSTGEIQIQALAEQYAAFEPSLHHDVHAPAPDLAALTYTSLRLPACIDTVRLVLLGQSHEVFARHGYGDVMNWQTVSAPGRRRKMFFDGDETLAVLIASPGTTKSDVQKAAGAIVALEEQAAREAEVEEEVEMLVAAMEARSHESADGAVQPDAKAEGAEQEAGDAEAEQAENT